MAFRNYGALALAAALALGATACSGSSDGSAAKDRSAMSLKALRLDPCKPVSDGEAATILGVPIVSEAPKGTEGVLLSCAYISDPSGTKPQGGTTTTSSTTSTTEPGELPPPDPGLPGPSDLEPLTATVAYATGGRKGDVATLLPDGKAVKGLGDEARFDPARAARGPRLVVRDGGLVVTIEIGPTSADPGVVEKQATALARAALAQAPKVEAAKPASTKKLGDPCAEIGDGRQLGKALDTQVTVTPSPPDGCSLALTSGATVRLDPQAAAKDPDQQLEAFAQNSNGKDWKRTEVEVGDGAAWLANPDLAGDGVLMVVADDRVFLVSTTVSGGTDVEARQLSTSIARRAIG